MSASSSETQKLSIVVQEQNTRRQYLPPEKFPNEYTDKELFSYFTEKLLGKSDVLKTSQKDINAARKAMSEIIETEIAKTVNTFAKAALFAPREIRVLINYDPEKDKTEALLYCTKWPSKIE